MMADVLRGERDDFVERQRAEERMHQLSVRPSLEHHAEVAQAAYTRGPEERDAVGRRGGTTARTQLARRPRLRKRGAGQQALLHEDARQQPLHGAQSNAKRDLATRLTRE